MKTAETLLTFDKSVYDIIKIALDIKETKCKICDVEINKNNVGGFTKDKKVFCRNCLSTISG